MAEDKKAIRKKIVYFMYAIVGKILKSQVIPYIINIVLSEDDTDVLYEACWGLLELGCAQNKMIVYIIENDGLNALKFMVMIKNLKIARSAIRTIGNWCIQSAKIRDYSLKYNVHEYIIEILPKLEDTEIINDSLIVLCNIVRKGGKYLSYLMFAPRITQGRASKIHYPSPDQISKMVGGNPGNGYIS